MKTTTDPDIRRLEGRIADLEHCLENTNEKIARAAQFAMEQAVAEVERRQRERSRTVFQ